MKNIATALVLAQSEMSNPVKQASNPFFKSKYSDLNAVREAILPILNKHKISVLQPICQIDGKNYVKTLLLHESGETLESNTEIIFNKLNDAQAQGSGISYARRYGLQSFLCVGADDDDGNKASAVSIKPLATDENLTKAKLKGATITEVEKYYTLTEKQKNEY
jgi:hypothetical protein